MMPPIKKPSQRHEIGGKSRILFIEDNGTLRKNISLLLVRNGYDVTEAFDGADGLLKYNPGMFDVVICDNQMPNKNGSEVTAEIKGMSPPQQIIMFSGDTFTKDDKERIGADAYVAKGTAFSELLTAVRQLEKRKV
jgi:two-component system, NtrC family, nitrogen regulation response regulator NtrX